jgi:hypothetical protein
MKHDTTGSLSPRLGRESLALPTGEEGLSR